MAKEYDLIVLGTGGAGYRVARRCSEAGWRVAAIDNGLFGGTCDNIGCIPKKVLVGAAEAADLNRRFNELGIVTKADTDWQKLVEFKRIFVQKVPDETKAGLTQAGVEIYGGSPRFVSENQVEINGQTLVSKFFHIAVGAKPAKLQFVGSELLITSDRFLDLNELPAQIIFIGGGYVSFELAHVAARFGASVTILHTDDRPLPVFDPDGVKTLIAASQAAGIKVELSATAEDVAKNGDKFIVTAGGKNYEADLVVHGAGRLPAIDGLNLEVANVNYEKRGVIVNEYLQSVSNPSVYAGGDAAASGPPLSPVARLHGTIVADNLLGQKTKQPNYSSTPSVVFTFPPLARVGLLESEAKEKGLDIRVHTEDISGWFDAKRTNLKSAMSKVIIDNKTDKVLGAHLIGNHAEDLINIFGLAIEAGLTVQQIQAPIYSFPTPSDDIRFMV